MVEIDSLLAYHWLRGPNLRYDNYSTLITECLHFLQCDWTVNITHIFKERNQVTNFLANAPVDLHNRWSCALNGLGHLLQLDLMGIL